MTIHLNIALCCFLFILFYLGHYIGDFMLQSSYCAANKTTNATVRFGHSVVYGLFAVGLPLMAFSLASVGALDTVTSGWIIIVTVFTILSHFVIDDYKFTMWWVRHIKGDISDLPPQFVIVEIDQTLHKIIIFIVAFVLACV